MVGRKPTPEEFLAGKKGDFDLKLIREIAGLDLPVTQEEILSKDLSIEQSAVERSSSEAVTPEALDKSLRDSWLSEFETMFGRKPNPEEFLKAKEAGFVLAKLNDNPILAEPIEHTVIDSVQTSPVKATPIRQSKSKKVALALGALAIVSLGAAYFYFDSQTGLEVTADAFISAVNKTDYKEAAKLLSGKGDQWTEQEAKSLIDYLDSQQVNLSETLQGIVDSGGKTIYTDFQGNKLLGLVESNRLFGIFPEYRVMTYPLEVLVTSNLSGLEVDGIKIDDHQTQSIGTYHFAEREFKVTGRTDTGILDEKIVLDLTESIQNQLEVSLFSDDRQFTLAMPESVTDTSNIKVFVKDVEVATSDYFTLAAIDGQKLEIKAQFTYEGKEFNTESTTIMVEPGANQVLVKLKVSSKDQDELKRLATEKDKKETAEQKKEELKTQVTTFLTNYRRDVFESVDDQADYYAKYYDTSTVHYQEMREFTVGGGVSSSRISHYVAGTMDIKDVTEKDGNIIVTTYEEYTSYYTNGNPSKLFQKNKVYYLRPAGDSYVIYDMTVQ